MEDSEKERREQSVPGNKPEFAAHEEHHKPEPVHEPKPEHKVHHEHHKTHVHHEEHKEKKHKSKSSGGINWTKWAAAIQIILLVVIIYQINDLGAVAPGTDNENGAPNVPQPNAPTPTLDMAELLDDDDVKGEDDAPVTIVEFSEFECPFCGAYYGSNEEVMDYLKSKNPSWEAAYPKIIEEYVKTGKVKYVVRDFIVHSSAQKAAEAAECAGEQEKYWEMHDMLFENQENLDTASLKRYAREIGLNTNDFNTCLDSGEMASEVQKDFLDGQKAGVQGTPAFIINGKLLSGAQPFTVFKQVIDAELS